MTVSHKLRGTNCQVEICALWIHFFKAFLGYYFLLLVGPDCWLPDHTASFSPFNQIWPNLPIYVFSAMIFECIKWIRSLSNTYMARRGQWCSISLMDLSSNPSITITSNTCFLPGQVEVMGASDDRPPFISLSPLLSNLSLNVIDTWTVFHVFSWRQGCTNQCVWGDGVCVGAAAGWRNRQRWCRHPSISLNSQTQWREADVCVRVLINICF